MTDDATLIQVVTGIAETVGRIDAKVDGIKDTTGLLTDGLRKTISRVDELERGQTSVVASIETAREERKEAEETARKEREAEAERGDRRFKKGMAVVGAIAAASPTLTHALRQAGLL